MVFDQVSSCQTRFRHKLNIRFAYLTDEWYLLLEKPIPAAEEYDELALQENGLGMARGFLDEWEQMKGDVRETKRIKLLTLATGTLFAPTLKQTAKEFSDLTGVNVDVVSITNQRLGETITVAGLLMGQDVISQLSGRDLGDLVILPSIMFDHPDGVALDDVSPDQISRALGRPVILAAGMRNLWKSVTCERA